MGRSFPWTDVRYHRRSLQRPCSIKLATMKLSWSFAFSSLLCAVSAERLAHVYNYDPTPWDPTAATLQQTSSSVRAETARLILAQRLGISRYHSIKYPSDRQLEQINAFGGRQQKLFGADNPDRSRAHILVWLEDVEDAEGKRTHALLYKRQLISIPAFISKPSSAWTSHFTISHPPSASDNERLIQDMILQAESLPTPADPKALTYQSILNAEKLMTEIKEPSRHNEYLAVFRADKNSKVSLNELSVQLHSAFKVNTGLGVDGCSFTVVLMPPASSQTKRAAQPYGTYGLPSNLQPRRELTEAPLSLSSSPSSAPNFGVDDLEDFPTIAQANNGSTTAPLGILPSCFESEAVCTNKTNGCSGHGACGLLRKGSSKERLDCYGCLCTPTVQKINERAVKTTYWGGPACQKKDISTPFWLFVGSGVLLAFLISSGIGLLYSMGSEELPSVIGAGVSGPSRK